LRRLNLGNTDRSVLVQVAAINNCACASGAEDNFKFTARKFSIIVRINLRKRAGLRKGRKGGDRAQ
jgi:hypothetical protein